MKEIGIMERGGTAAVIKERRDHIAVFENISDANIITPKRLIAIIWEADPYMRESIIVDATLTNTGMMTWDMSQAIITMENMKADIRTIVASPLVEVEEVATKVTTGLTTALHIIVHLGRVTEGKEPGV